MDETYLDYNGLQRYHELLQSQLPVNKQAASNGTDLSLVTTGEKATWNAKQDALTFNTTPSSSNKVATMADVPTNTALLESSNSSANQAEFNPETDSLRKTSQVLTTAEKTQVLTNLGIVDKVGRNIFISTSDPTSSDGSNGDIWLVYEN